MACRRIDISRIISLKFPFRIIVGITHIIKHHRQNFRHNLRICVPFSYYHIISGQLFVAVSHTSILPGPNQKRLPVGLRIRLMTAPERVVRCPPRCEKNAAASLGNEIGNVILCADQKVPVKDTLPVPVGQHAKCVFYLGLNGTINRHSFRIRQPSSRICTK